MELFEGNQALERRGKVTLMLLPPSTSTFLPCFLESPDRRGAGTCSGGRS
jgi:hypothetical protein